MANKGGEEKEKKGRRAVRLLGFGLVLVLLALAVAAYLWHVKGRVVTDDAYVHATIYPVSSRVPGAVIEVMVEDNQLVDPGQLLVRLDPEGPALKVRMARAAVEAARTQAEEAETALRGAEAEKRLVEAKLEQARIDLARIEALWKKRSIAKEQYDRTLTQYRVLSAQRHVSEARIASAKARIAASKKNLESAEAQLAHAKLLLRYTEIRAPARGQVTEKSVEVGQVIQPGLPLMAVVDLEDLWIEANYKESQTRGIRPGQRAEVKVDAFPNHSFRGHVESMHAGTGAAFSLFPPENATGNWVKVVQRIPVKVILDGYRPSEGSPVLRVGMSAVVKIHVREGGEPPWPLSLIPGL